MPFNCTNVNNKRRCYYFTRKGNNTNLLQFTFNSLTNTRKKCINTKRSKQLATFTYSIVLDG